MNGPGRLRRGTLALAAILLLPGAAAATATTRDAGAPDPVDRHRPVVERAPDAERSALAAARLTPAGDLADPARSPGHLLAEIDHRVPVFARPGGRQVGSVAATSPYYGTPTVAWVLRVTADGRFGRVPVPYAGRDLAGWIRLRGLRVRTTRVSVLADLSRHRLWVSRGDDVILSAPAATGAPASPTPTGRYTVSDRVAFPGGGVFGTYAFGLTGIQPDLPAGWTGGDQLAIHGTDDPSSIGRSVSAGCLRVSERVLDRLRRLLAIGTPVTVRA